MPESPAISLTTKVTEKAFRERERCHSTCANTYLPTDRSPHFTRTKILLFASFSLPHSLTAIRVSVTGFGKILPL